MLKGSDRFLAALFLSVWVTCLLMLVRYFATFELMCALGFSVSIAQLILRGWENEMNPTDDDDGGV